MPTSVLERVQKELLVYPGAGASIMEVSHRGGIFKNVMAQCEADLRKLLAIPETHEVLFLQGGARLQFSMIPMNLLQKPNSTADYLVTGSWSSKALDEAKKEGTIRVVWNGAEGKYSSLPSDAELDLNPEASFAYYASNETIQGIQFQTEPNVGNVPLVCDASSDLLYRPLPIEKYGLLYACAQKNVGPAGVTVVIMRKDLLERSCDGLPGMMNYKNHAEGGSMYNTPPTFAVYVMGLVMKWLLEEVGGLEAMHERNKLKSQMLYEVIDASDGFYTGHAQPNSRSLMNVVFRLPDDASTEKFIAEAESKGMSALKGHRSVGGIRASIYNAMPVEGVETLRDFMVDFRKRCS